jgi:hypothetical protein
VPRGRRLVPFLLLPPALLVGFSAAYLAAVHLGGDVLGIDAVGGLATSTGQLLDCTADLLGPDVASAAGAPPPPGGAAARRRVPQSSPAGRSTASSPWARSTDGAA